MFTSKMNYLRCLAFKTRNLQINNIKRHCSNRFEPEYLEAMKPKYPQYDTLNIQIRGYDFSILESFQRLIHNLAKNMEVDVEECWGVPAQDMQISTFKSNSEILDSQFNLKVYERTVQITDVSSLQLPILLRALEASTPAGVMVDVVAHEDYHDEVRYVPDKELLELKNELDVLGGPRKTK